MNIEDVKLGDLIHVKSHANEHWLIYIVNNSKDKFKNHFNTYSLYLKDGKLYHDFGFPLYESDTISYMSLEEKQKLIRKIKQYRMNKK